MATREGPPSLLEVPQRNINFVPASGGETFKLGAITIRIMEDGSRTDNRLGTLEFIVPPHQSGPASHWHEMHDETFLVTKGTVRFSTIGLKQPQPDIDAKAGDYVTVPIRAPHTFSNPFDEEARMFNTFTPAYFLNYFKLMATMAEKEGGFSPEIVKAAMTVYATLGVEDNQTSYGAA